MTEIENQPPHGFAAAAHPSVLGEISKSNLIAPAADWLGDRPLRPADTGTDRGPPPDAPVRGNRHHP